MNTRNLVKSYLAENDWRINENSNTGFSLQGLNNYITNHVIADYWLNEIYPPHIKQSHTTGKIHIHDLANLSTYCCGWDLQQLLQLGFCGVGLKSESAPARHFRTALGQLVNFIYTMQGEAAGAQAVSSFDTLLAPFVYYDKLDYKETKQAIQEFVFNMNVPVRVGFQAPFSNITLDLQPSPVYANQPAIIGGKLMNKTYGEFQSEMNMINRAFAEVMLDGDAKGRVFTFPIPTYNITKDFDWDNPELEPIWKMTAKYGIPYFSNYVNSDMKPEDARSMCCRLRLRVDEIHKRGGGLFGSNPLTGSIGVVTINLPQLAYLTEYESEFFDGLEMAMNIAKESLEIKRIRIEQYTEQGLYPYSRFYLQDIKAKTGHYWTNHFSTIGLIGMNEATMELFGKDIVAANGFAVKVLKFMRDKLAEFQNETKNLYNLEATPAEGTSYRLAKIDSERCYNIATQGTKDAPYYTNSTQLPVNYTDDLFFALDWQDELQSLYTGGTVLHLFLGEQIDDWKQARDLIKKVASNYRLPYVSLTPTFSICPEHKYLSGNVEICPYCGKECEQYSRVVGYLRPVQGWNKGKKQEFAERVTYNV